MGLGVMMKGTGLTLAMGALALSAVGSAQLVVSGTGEGRSGVVNVHNGSGTLFRQVTPFPSFFGGIRVAAGDVNGDGFTDVIAGQGSAGGGRVKVFDGISNAPLFDFMAFGQSYSGGVQVAAGDVNGDGRADILVGGDIAGGPVKIFSGLDLSILHNFFAFSQSAMGVRVAAGDVNGDGVDDVMVAPGPGVAPEVSVYNGLNGQTLHSFFAFTPSFTGGVFVAAGDLNGDGIDDIATSEGPGTASHVKVFNGNDLSILKDFSPWGTFSGGVYVGAGDIDGNTSEELILATGPGFGEVKAYDQTFTSIYSNFPDGASSGFGNFIAGNIAVGPDKFALALSKTVVAGQNFVGATIVQNRPLTTARTYQMYDNTSLVATPASAIIPAGAVNKTVSLSTTAVNSTINVTIFAKFGTTVVSQPLMLAPLVPTAVAFTPNNVQGGTNVSCRVVINGVAGPGGRTISIVENSPYATAPTSITVPPGGTDFTFTITTTGVPSNKTVNVRAIVSAGQASGNLYLVP